MKYDKIKWTNLFISYSLDLKKKYKNYDEKYFNKLINPFILELSIKKNNSEEIKAQYRILSKKYHPDLGGDPIIFNLITKAKDQLLS